MVDLRKLIAQANSLAPLPTSTVRLAGMSSDSNCHLDEIAGLVEFDQALTVRLLRAANSAFSASAMPVSTVGEAVARMGTQQVMELAVAAGVSRILQAPIAGYGLDEGALWRHSVAAAVSTEIARDFCQVEVPPESFTAALLHDIGKLVMGRYLSPDILGFIRRAQEVDHLDQLAAESLLLFVHHGELGGLMAQHWKLPPRIVLGIIHHHTPALGRDAICDVTYLANQLAKHVEAGLAGRTFEGTLDAGVVERLGLPPDALEHMGPLASERFVKVSSRYNVL